MKGEHMLNLTLQEIARVVDARLIGDGSLTVQSAVSDSRHAAPGLFFVALPGARVDGHDYAQEALSRGAVAVMTQRELPEIAPQLVVSSCKEALATLGRYQLARYPLKIVAITGSMGKTTTKELMAAVLSSRFAVLKTEGNLNTEVSLPLVLFGLTKEHQVAVLEMGMTAKGDIRELCGIAPPDIAVITNIHEVHLERLGSIEAIAETKGEIFHALHPEGLAIVNADDPRVVAKAQEVAVKSYSYGILNQADMMASQLHSHGLRGSSFVATFPDGSTMDASLPVPGIHMVQNALPAMLVGFLMGLSQEEIARGLAVVEPTSQRLSARELPGSRLMIDDSYNSNPHSVAAALALVGELRGTRPTYLVLGDMRELGELSDGAHRGVGALVAQLQPTALYTLGSLAVEIASEAVRLGYPEGQVASFTTNQQVLDTLLAQVPTGALLLIKGSRGLGMEVIARGLEAKW